jgi:hypothetical protein
MIGYSCWKRHLPYHECDHVLNLAYNALLDGQQLEDIELRRNDEVFLEGLGAQRIPDPTTSGDFTRRLHEGSILHLMEAINAVRQRCRKSSGGIFSAIPLLIPTAPSPGLLGGAKGGWHSPIKGSGVMRL